MLPLSFTGGQRVWPVFSTPLAFEPPSFRYEARYRYHMKSRTKLSCIYSMSDLLSHQIWHNSAHAPVKSRRHSGQRRLNTDMENCDKSSITQPCIAQSCWNLIGGIVESVDWMSLVIKAQNDWRVVEQPQVAMHRNCYLF